MEMARYTKTPELWAGLGRAVNNLVAVVISGGSLALLNSKNNVVIIVIELLLFVLTSIATLTYTNRRKTFFEKNRTNFRKRLDEVEKVSYTRKCKGENIRLKRPAEQGKRA